jgi:hypothetical protein
LREDSCRSTSAARAENFFEEDKAIREFPKGNLRFSCLSVPIFAAYATWWESFETPFWRGNQATAIANKDNAGYVGVITPVTGKLDGSNSGGR